MQGSTCPKCGAPLGPGTQFCAYCGAPVPYPTSPPLAFGGTSATPLPGAYPPMGYGTPPAPPPRRHRRTLLLVILVVVILIIGVIAVVSFESQAPPIQVGFINIWAPDNVCGLNANPIAYYGYNDTTGSSESLDFPVPNYNATACTIESVATNSSGFSLSNVEVPLVIPGNGTGSMNMTISNPTSSFTGNLNLVLS